MALASVDFQLTYRQLQRQIEAFADQLAPSVKGEHRLGLLLPNEAAFPIALHALFRSGRSALLLNPANSPRELAEQIEDAGVSVVITTERLRTQLPPVVRVVLVPGEGRSVSRDTTLGAGDARPGPGDGVPFSGDAALSLGSALPGPGDGGPGLRDAPLGRDDGAPGAVLADGSRTSAKADSHETGRGEDGVADSGGGDTLLAERAAWEYEAVTIFTSAMSGRARGAVLTHRNLVANLRSTVDALDLVAGDRVYAALPFAHAFGLTVCLNAVLAAGATVLPVPKFNPLNALDELTSLRPTVLAGVPAMFIGMIAAAERKGVPPHSLRITLCGGAPLPLEVARRWEELFGLPLRQGYGLTEASPVCLFNLTHHPNRPGTLGTPFPGVEVSIRDGAGNELPEGEVGQLCIRGENVFGGYLGDAESDGPFLGGWLQTGDLASQSGDVVRFRGLLKPMFTRNGFNVYPEEIRRVLKQDERIAEVLVCARPDFARENEVVLEVRAKPGVLLSEAEVKELCAERLASYKQPSRIRVYFDREQ